MPAQEGLINPTPMLFMMAHWPAARVPFIVVAREGAPEPCLTVIWIRTSTGVNSSSGLRSAQPVSPRCFIPRRRQMPPRRLPSRSIGTPTRIMPDYLSRRKRENSPPRDWRSISTPHPIQRWCCRPSAPARTPSAFPIKPTSCSLARRRCQSFQSPPWFSIRSSA